MNHYLLPGLEAVPTICRRLLDRIDASRLDEAITPGRFTPREVIAHLADWEPIMRERVRMACAAPGSTIEVFDEGEMAAANRYADSDPYERLELFRRERAVTAELVRRLQPAAMTNVVLHPERGPMTADDLTNLLLAHDVYHVEQLSAYLDGGTAGTAS